MLSRILHIDMDAFFVSVEQAMDPSLKGRPVIVGGDPNGRGVVAAASYEARACGVRSAMPLARARRLCPDAVFLRGNPKRYALASQKVFAILRRYSPLVEPVSIDEAYMDLSGLGRLYGAPIDIATRIQKEIQEGLSLMASGGLSTNKIVSKVASGYAKPGGIAEVLPGYEARFLAPFPVERLPGVGEKALERLKAFNIRTIGALAQIDASLLERTFGKPGLLLHQRARGLGPTAIVSERRPPRSIGREVTFEKDTLDRGRLEAVLYGMSEEVARSLREARWAARTITLTLRYSDFMTLSRSSTRAEATAMDHEIFRTARSLLDRAFFRRSRVRLIGVSASNLRKESGQLPLFDPEGGLRWQRLYQALDRIRERYGDEALQVGRTIFLWPHPPSSKSVIGNSESERVTGPVASSP